MAYWKDANLVAVEAVVIPAGSIIESSLLEMDILVYGKDGKHTVSHDYLDDEDGYAFEKFVPEAGSERKYVYDGDVAGLIKTIYPIVAMDIRAFGDGFGRVSCGLSYEIEQTGLDDAFQEEDFIQMAQLAEEHLNEHKKSREYIWSRNSRRREGDSLAMDVEDQQCHIVLAYSYGVSYDDYNKESDVYIDFLQQVDLNTTFLKIAGSNS